MATELGLVLVGLSHRTCGVQVREASSVADAEISARLARLMQQEGLDEALLLSTCNRTELLVASSLRQSDTIDELLRREFFSSAPDDAVYCWHDLEAVLHLFRVAAGLDSQVLGEGQILAQLKQARYRASEAKSLGPRLDPLLQQALSAGKRVRKETALGEGTLSVARAGVEVAQRVVGQLAPCNILMVGAGDTGRLAAQHLLAEGAHQLMFCNRTLERAERAAREFNGHSAPLDQLADLLPRADVVFCCVDNAPGLIGDAHVDRRALKKRDRPLVLVDLSVPRAVDPALGDLSNMVLYDLDHLAGIVAKNEELRRRATEQAAPMLFAEAQKFLGLRAYASLRPTIVRLGQRFDASRQEVLDNCLGDQASEAEREMAHRLTKRLLDVALDEFKQSARSGVENDDVDRAFQRLQEKP